MKPKIIRYYESAMKSNVFFVNGAEIIYTQTDNFKPGSFKKQGKFKILS